MAKVIMTCGKICSGKSTYAKSLLLENQAVVLSVDEIMLALFGQQVGDMHDEYVARTEKYLFDKSADVIENGISVILDWGFWTRAERAFARKFYGSRNIKCEFHYIDIKDELWMRRIENRNRLISEGKLDAYYVDEKLAQKFGAIFEPPSDDEIDVRINANSSAD